MDIVLLICKNCGVIRDYESRTLPPVFREECPVCHSKKWYSKRVKESFAEVE